MRTSFKKTYLLLFVVLFHVTATNICYADDPNPKNPTQTEKNEAAKKTEEVEKAKVAEAAKEAKTKENAESSRLLPAISEPTVKIICVLFFVVMLVLIILFFIQAYLNDLYFGFWSIKFIGLVIIFPGICIIALIGGGNLISGSTLAALLGTIAGYVLSKEDDSAKNSYKKNKDALSKEKDELAEENKNLKAEVERLKALLPN